MKQSVLLTAFVLLGAGVHAQQVLTLTQRTHELNKYIGDTVNYVPPYILDQLLDGYQKGLSGTTVKDGKYASSSLSVDEKGASIQTFLKPFKFSKGSLYSGLTFSGRGDDKFVEVFKNGVYRQTLSMGGAFNFFPKLGKAKFYPCDKWVLKARVDAVLKNKKTVVADTAQVKYLNGLLDIMREYERAYDTCWNYKDSVKLKRFKDMSSQLERVEAAPDTFIALKLLPQDYRTLPQAKKVELLNNLVITEPELTRMAENVEIGNRVKKAEKILLNAYWTSVRLEWFTLKVNYNISPQPIINANKKDKNYLETYYNEYVTFTLGYNYLWKYHGRRQFQVTFSPAASASTARDFASLDKISISKTQPYTAIPGDTAIRQTVFSSEGYESRAARKFGFSIEAPLVLFWGSANIGVDIAVRGGMNNPNKDNFGGRLGVYIPVEVNDNIPIWIEPVMRVGKLFEARPEGVSNNFWKDNVTVGFNVSVALKQITLFKK